MMNRAATAPGVTMTSSATAPGGVRGDRLAQLRQAQVVAVLEDEAAQVHAEVRERCVRDGALRQVPPDPSVAQLLGRLLLDRHPPVAHVNLHSTLVTSGGYPADPRSVPVVAPCGAWIRTTSARRSGTGTRPRPRRRARHPARGAGRRPLRPPLVRPPAGRGAGRDRRRAPGLLSGPAPRWRRRPRYQATFEGFAARGLDHEAAADLLRRSVELAERARSSALDEGVAGRCSSPRPSGRTAPCSPTARSTAAATGGPWRSWPTSTASASGSSRRTGADVLAVETIPEIEEARAVAGAPGRASRYRGLDQLLLRRRRAPARRRADRGGGPGDQRRARAWSRPASTAPPRSTSTSSSSASGRCRRCPSPSTPTAARAGTRSRGAGRGPRPGGWTASRGRPLASRRGPADRRLLPREPLPGGRDGPGARDRRRRVTMSALPSPSPPIAQLPGGQPA